MPAFLVTILKWVIGLFIEQVVDRAKKYLVAKKAEQQRREEIIRQVNESIQPLKDAKTKEEIDAAVRKALDDV